MYLKLQGWIFGVWEKIDHFNDQDFVNEVERDLFHTLSANPSSLIGKYIWIYFTWYEDIDKEILDTILLLSEWNLVVDSEVDTESIVNNNELWQNDKIKKLLFILKRTITITKNKINNIRSNN